MEVLLLKVFCLLYLLPGHNVFFFYYANTIFFTFYLLFYHIIFRWINIENCFFFFNPQNGHSSPYVTERLQQFSEPLNRFSSSGNNNTTTINSNGKWNVQITDDDVVSVSISTQFLISPRVIIHHHRHRSEINFL